MEFGEVKDNDVQVESGAVSLNYRTRLGSTVRSYEFEDNIKAPVVTSEHKTNVTDSSRLSRASQKQRYSRQGDNEKQGSKSEYQSMNELAELPVYEKTISHTLKDPANHPFILKSSDSFSLQKPLIAYGSFPLGKSGAGADSSSATYEVLPQVSPPDSKRKILEKCLRRKAGKKRHANDYPLKERYFVGVQDDEEREDRSMHSQIESPLRYEHVDDMDDGDVIGVQNFDSHFEPIAPKKPQLHNESHTSGEKEKSPSHQHLLDPAPQKSTSYTLLTPPSPQDAHQKIQRAYSVYGVMSGYQQLLYKANQIDASMYWVLSAMSFLLSPVMALLAVWFTAGVEEAREMGNHMAEIERAKIVKLSLAVSIAVGVFTYSITAFGLAYIYFLT